MSGGLLGLSSKIQAASNKSSDSLLTVIVMLNTSLKMLRPGTLPETE